METIQSRYLKRDFSFTPATMQRNDGPITIIPHNELWDIIHNQISIEIGVVYEYSPVTVTKEHCFIGCTMRDAAGRSVTEFGESVAESLTSSIAKTIPGTMAQIRAFDRAAIRYLDFACDGKVYSDQEIPSSEYSAPAAKKEKPTEKAEEKVDTTSKADPAPTSEAPVQETPAVESKSNVENALPTRPPVPENSSDIGKVPLTWQNDNVKKTVLDGIAEHTEIIIFDTETSGLKPATDRILELSAKKFAIDGGKLGAQLDELHVYIKPPFSIDPKITELNGISDELLEDKPVEEEAFIDIFSFFGEKPQIITAYNTPFDFNFMSALYKRQEKTFAPLCKLDVLDMARDLVKGISNHKLETVAEHFGLQGDNFHNADFDTDCTVKLFEILLKEYSSADAKPDDISSEKLKPLITSITLFDKSTTLRRIYVNTDKGTLYFDLVKKNWASKDAKLEEIDMEYLEKEAWNCVGAADQSTFENFKGNWSAAA